MTATKWIRIGTAVATVLSVIAAFLGVLAVMIVLSMLPSLFASPWNQLGTEFAIAVVLLACLCAAVTPFVAVRFFTGLSKGGVLDAKQRRSAGRVGALMTAVALPWWLVFLTVIGESNANFENYTHLVFQTLLTATPASLATICAVAAFRVRTF